VLPVVTLLALWTALGGASGSRCQPTVELVLPPKVRLGDPVAITLEVRNDGSQALDLELPGRPVAFDIIILGPDGTEVWRRLHHAMTGSALMLLRLKPGESREFTAEWAQVDNHGRRVPPGRYLVRGVLPAQMGRLMTKDHELVIAG
jgi:intracellular proteinase inhibitor BsuPI